MEFNPLFTLIKYNKWRFAVLGIGMALIIGALVAMMIIDPLPWWALLIALGIFAGCVASAIWHWRRYRRWEDEDESSSAK